MPIKGYLVEQAMKKAGVWASSPPDDRQDCLRALERMAEEWGGQDPPVYINYPLQAHPEWTCECPNLPAIVQNALISNLAVRIAVDFNVPVSADLRTEAANAKRSVVRPVPAPSAAAAYQGWPLGAGHERRFGDRRYSAPRLAGNPEPRPEENF